ncbi:hypothetical protein [Acidianus manzaensis]|uniref:Uncharacterized protein n=1 Tax=Acidianus manzaensis TaxID=282676 RepID=A0A1W6JYJ2_9CREN|nr:hypothetical protein [Acidianus manzaensis]ARM75339.1 hypothetical protein B6F84_04355 [Acidianus manzaensis]
MKIKRHKIVLCNYYYFSFLILFTIILSSFLSLSVTSEPNYGCVEYTVYLGNFSTVKGSSLNYFSPISPSSIVMDSSGNVYVAAVNEIYILNSSGNIIRNISVSGAEYLYYYKGIILAASGTLPNYTLTLINSKNFSIIKTIILNTFPLSVSMVKNQIYIGTSNGIGELKGNKIEFITLTPGPVTSMLSVNGTLFASGYNLSRNYGFLDIIKDNKLFEIMIINNTFPNSLYYKNNILYIASDFEIIILNLNNNSIRYISIPGEEIQGIAIYNGHIYATADSLYGPDFVLVLNSTTVLSYIKVGITPIGIVYNNFSKLLFVSNFFDGTISIIGFNCSKTSTNTTESVVENNLISSIINVVYPMHLYLIQIVLASIIGVILLAYLIFRRAKERK